MFAIDYELGSTPAQAAGVVAKVVQEHPEAWHVIGITKAA